MKRRQFIQTAGAATALCAGVSNAQSLVQTLGDAALRLNPLIQPEERVEKRVFAATSPDVVSWETTVYRSLFPPYGKIFKTTNAYLHTLKNDSYLPLITNPLVRRDYQSTAKQGFYFYFKTFVALMKLPNIRPEEFISSSGKYFYCNRSDQSIVGTFPKGWMTIDYREIRLIDSNTVHSPTHEVYRPIKDQVVLDVAPSLRVIDRPTEIPREDYRGSSMWIEKVLFFDLPQRPIRFTLELPPMIIQGIEVPLPTCYFEPFDTATDKWV